MSHQTKADYEAIDVSNLAQIVQLLTDLSEERLRAVGPVCVRNVVIDEAVSSSV